MSSDNIVILGAGMAGFGAAHRFHEAGLPTTLYEQRDYHGGHTASHIFPEGFTFDEGPHISFTKSARLQNLFADSVEGEFETLQTNVTNYWKGHWIKHPAQTNLYGLPTNLIVSILKDFTAVHGKPAPEIRNYADWLISTYGQTFAQTFPMEYTRKYHTTTAENMSIDWIGPRMYQPSIDEVLQGALAPNAPEVHYISHFRYPRRGGFVQFLNRFVKETNLKTGHRLTHLNPVRRELHFANGRVTPYGHLVSSIPLPELIPLIDGAPADIREAAGRLACSEVVVVNLGFSKRDIIDATWTYFYDQDFFLTRLSTPHLQSRNNVPSGCCSIQAECYFSEKYRPLGRRPEDCIDPVIEDLRRCGLIAGAHEVVYRGVMHIKYANVIFDLESAAAVATVHGFLDDIGVRYCGRYGDWAYIWTDQSFESGERAATRVIDSLHTYSAASLRAAG